MALLVQKFGGSSLATVDLIRSVAERVKREVIAGHQVVVVVSAMQGDTDRLVALSQSVSSARQFQRENAALLATGEQQSAALLSMALLSMGVQAQSMNAYQARILTRGSYERARISTVDPTHIRQRCEQGVVPVITGFQGVTEQDELTNIGRGGSDLTAVALAHWLRADECQIYTDVDGVYTVDPNVVPEASLVTQLSYAEMLELSRHGAKVLQYRSVEYASRYQVPVFVSNSKCKERVGTCVSSTASHGSLPHISGIALDRNQAKVMVTAPALQKHKISGLPILLQDNDIEVDMFMQHFDADTISIKFTTHLNDHVTAVDLVRRYVADIDGAVLSSAEDCAKVSLIGLGMKRHAKLSIHIMRLLENAGISVEWLSSFSHRISLMVPAKDLEKCACLLHAEYIHQNEKQHNHAYLL
jgi:aspartate kinase